MRLTTPQSSEDSAKLAINIFSTAYNARRNPPPPTPIAKRFSALALSVTGGTPPSFRSRGTSCLTDVNVCTRQDDPDHAARAGVDTVQAPSRRSCSKRASSTSTALSRPRARSSKAHGERRFTRRRSARPSRVRLPHDAALHVAKRESAGKARRDGGGDAQAHFMRGIEICVRRLI